MRSVQFYRTLLRQDTDWKNQCALLEYANSRVEVREYDARHAPVELTIAMLKHVYGW